METGPVNNYIGHHQIQKTDKKLLSNIRHGNKNIKSRISELAERHFLNPSEKEIKKDLFSLSTRHLYSKLASLKAKPEKYVITGCVFDDGVGDYYHILNVAEKIKERFPNIEVTMVVPHKDEHLPEKVRKPLNSDITVFFHNYNWRFSMPLRPEDTVFMNTDRIIDVSMPNDEPVASTFSRKKKEKYTYIGEYGKPRGMGLNDNDLGILIRDKPQPSSLLELKNEKLKNILFGTATPSQEDLKNYQDSHELHIGYIKERSNFLFSLIYTSSALFNSSNKKTLDLVIPPVDLKYIDTQFLIGQGIGKITFLKKEGDEIIQKEQILDPNAEKELRFISIMPLEQEDFYNLIANTNPLVGCTGDHSLSEVISFDRIPFYEVRNAKIEFQKQMIYNAGKVGSSSHYLQQYLQELLNLYNLNPYDNFSKSVSNSSRALEQLEDQLKKARPQTIKSSLKMADLIANPEFEEECHQFNELLRNQYSFNLSLENLIERQIAIDNSEDLKTIEEELEAEYLEGKLTLIEAQKKLIDKIQSIVDKNET